MQQRAQSHPRTKKGKMIVATKDGPPGESPDRLLVNSYMGRHVVKKPEYWTKLLTMLYGEGRLKTYAGAVEDIVDKFSFLLLAKDAVLRFEETSDPDKRFYVKYFAYTYMFMTKSLLDSLAVFINGLFDLGFSGGKVDLKLGRFVDALKIAHAGLGGEVERRKKWIAYVVKYRDSLIHKHSLYVGPLATIPDGMTDPVEIDRVILSEPHYMPSDPDSVDDQIIEEKEVEFVKVICLMNEWLAESSGLFDAVLRVFATQFELAEASRE
jgi:hypothetical protein